MQMIRHWIQADLEPLSDDDDRAKAAQKERRLWERTRRLERMAVEADVVQHDERPEWHTQ